MALNGTLLKEGGLTPRQSAALPYIASEPNLARAAQAAQIGKRTLMRWMNDPAFRSELERVRNNIADLAYTELEGLTLKSVFRIAQLLDHEDPNVVHRVSKTALSMSLSLRQNRDLRRQLELIENAQAMARQQQ